MGKICDICNASMTSEEMTVVSSSKMKEAVRNGWRPSKDHISSLGSSFGIDSDKLFFQQVMMDNSDWGLCASCIESFPSSEEKLTDNTLISTSELVLVKGGTFDMGDVMGDNEDDRERPVHSVTLSDFLIGKCAVTFEEYDAFCSATGRSKPGDAGWGRGRRPVIDVSWEDAVAYCNWRSQEEGLMEVYSKKESWLEKLFGFGSTVTANWQANGYRLPTEAEWEYAAREGGKKVRFGNGKDIADPKEINFDGSAGNKRPYSVVGEYRGKTVPVGSLNSPNALGLHDMSGNVWEWCWDWYGDYPAAAQTNPKGPNTGSYRVLRGGSWFYYPQYCRVANRSNYTPGGGIDVDGFRLARTL